MSQEKVRRLLEGYRSLPLREYELDRDKIENFAANKAIHRLKQENAETVMVGGARAGGLVIG